MNKQETTRTLLQTALGAGLGAGAGYGLHQNLIPVDRALAESMGINPDADKYAGLLVNPNLGMNATITGALTGGISSLLIPGLFGRNRLNTTVKQPPGYGGNTYRTVDVVP